MTVSDTRATPSENPEDLLIQMVADWMLRDLAAPPSFVEICERLDLTEYQLKTGFLRLYQASPSAWLRQQRLRRAAVRLVETDQTIAAIALGVGFQNPSRFAEAFRREFGIVPSEFRRPSVVDELSASVDKGPVHPPPC